MSNATYNPALERVRQMLAQRAKEREEREANKAKLAEQMQRETKHIPFAAKEDTKAGQSGGEIVLNTNQLQAVESAKRMQSMCLIGAAGTGKTTTVREIVKQTLAQIAAEAGGQIPADSVALVAYTNRAVRNIKKAVTEIGADKYCSTIHKFLGYAPEYFEYENEAGDLVKSMRFVPTYHELNPIDSCKLVIVDESSMCDTRLFAQLQAATPNAIYIFIGDLFQLTPVFGDPILGYKLNEVPVVELTQVYRQAMESPIIWFQHNYTLAGKLPSDTELTKLNDRFADKGLVFTPFKKQFDDGESMALAVASYMIKKYEAGEYDPQQDTILIPYNKSFGSDWININLAEYFGKKYHRTVYEVIAGFEKHYYAVDDFVMYEKRECTIVSIERNRQYFGTMPQEESTDLNRFGYYRTGGHNQGINLDHAPDTVDFEALLAATSADADGDSELRKTAASHVITMRDNDTGDTLVARTAGEVNAMSFGFAMTVHKSQGSEWRKVWFVACRQHRNMLSRELLYTGMTRAKEYLEMIYTPQTVPGKRDNSIARAIKNQQIPGNDWRTKAKYYFAKAKTMKSQGDE